MVITAETQQDHVVIVDAGAWVESGCSESSPLLPLYVLESTEGRSQPTLDFRQRSVDFGRLATLRA